jgi:hypothetical protein
VIENAGVAMTVAVQVPENPGSIQVPVAENVLPVPLMSPVAPICKAIVVKLTVAQFRIPLMGALVRFETPGTVTVPRTVPSLPTMRVADQGLIGVAEP